MVWYRCFFYVLFIPIYFFNNLGHTTMEKYSKKKHIFDAGSTLFHKQGYAATSMRNLAQEVQLEVSSLYSHIGSKEEILREICFNMVDKLNDEIEKVYGNTQNPRKKIKKIIKIYLKLILENKSDFTVYHKEYIHLSESHMKAFLAKKSSCNQMCAMIIQEGIKTGEFRSVDPYFAMKTMYHSMSWINNWHNVDKDSFKSIYKQFRRLLLDGLEKQ